MGFQHSIYTKWCAKTKRFFVKKQKRKNLLCAQISAKDGEMVQKLHTCYQALRPIPFSCVPICRAQLVSDAISAHNSFMTTHLNDHKFFAINCHH